MTLRSFLPRELPPGLEALSDLALDLRWTWSHTSDHLWRTIDPATWDVTHNPWIIIQNAPRERLDALAADPSFRALLDEILEQRRERGQSAVTGTRPGRATRFAFP